MKKYVKTAQKWKKPQKTPNLRKNRVKSRN
jgi:hypothetical protein